MLFVYNIFKKLDAIDKEWKEKAKTRRLENKKLKKRINELLESRDKWKEKADKLKKANDKINEELKKTI
jgi:regulator of replication initiation timing